MILPNKVYDILKWITQIVLPACGTLYFALSGIWGLPYGDAVVGTITAVVTFLGVLLGISSSQYKSQQGSESDGAIVIDPQDPISGSTYLQFDKTIENLQNKDKIVLNVVSK